MGSYEPQGALVRVCQCNCVSICTHWCVYVCACANVCLAVCTRAFDLPVIAMCSWCAEVVVVFVLVLEPLRYAEVL